MPVWLPDHRHRERSPWRSTERRPVKEEKRYEFNSYIIIDSSAVTAWTATNPSCPHCCSGARISRLRVEKVKNPERRMFRCAVPSCWTVSRFRKCPGNSWWTTQFDSSNNSKGNAKNEIFFNWNATRSTASGKYARTKAKKFEPGSGESQVTSTWRERELLKAKRS